MDKRLDLFTSCFSFKNLLYAADECYKGVKWKRQPQKYMNNKLTNTRKLQKELFNGTYKLSSVKKFVVNERGKIRYISPVAFRDRVAQRCLCDNLLTPIISSQVISDCSACLKGRGLSYAHKRVLELAEETSLDSWVLQFDFHDYFHNIDRNILLSMLNEIILDKRILKFINTVISTSENGLELGSHVSQLLAAYYPTKLDKNLKGYKGVTGYHRYMDDGIVFCKTKEDVLKAKEILIQEAQSLNIILNDKKVYYNKITHPFVFCKIRFTKQLDGSVRKNVRKPQTRYSMQHIKRVKNKAKYVDIDLVPVKASFYGYIQRGDANLIRLYNQI